MPNYSTGAPVQKVWGWKIAAYLFGAGMGAGAYVVSTLGLLFGTIPDEAGIFGMTLGVIAVLLAVPFLIWDLERPHMFWRVLVKVKKSWVSRGAWILMIFGAWAVLTLALGVWFGVLGVVGWSIMAWVGVAGGICVAAYTGLLIGTLLARPLWNTSVLPALFMVSALSTGIAATVFAGYVFAGGLGGDIAAYAHWTGPLHLALLVFEGFLIYFHLNICYGRVKSGVLNLIKGTLARPFWLLVVGAGVVLPILLEVAAMGGAGMAAELLAHAGVLIGGFTLRRVVLAAGTRAEIENLGTTFAIRPEW